MTEHDHNEVLRDALSMLNEEVPPMPEGLHAAWMQKVEDDMENTRTEKTRFRKTLTRYLSVAAALVFVIGGTLLTRDDLSMPSLSAPQETYSTAAYGAALANNYKAYDDVAEEEYAMEADYDGGVMLTSMVRGAGVNGAFTADEAPAVTEKKIIRTASLTIATQTFEDSLAALRSQCEVQGGWIESSSESLNSYSGLRTAYLTLRIPQNTLDDYLDVTGRLGRVTSRSESAEDVTASYQDTQSRLETQLALMARLQSLITESADLSDLLELESQIADTQYTIDRLQSSLNSTDRQVSYSTVSVTLKEEKTPELTDTTVSLGERIKAGIRMGWESLTSFLSDMLVFLVAALPYILIVAVVVILVKVIRRFKRR